MADDVVKGCGENEPETERDGLSRRRMLAAGGAAALAWRFALDPAGAITIQESEEEAPWRPLFLSAREAEEVAALCDAILPRTDTPGARDARVHEYIDLVLSLASPGEQQRFREGLEWLNGRARERFGRRLGKVTAAQRVALLEEISDAHDEHPDALRRGARFFADLKEKTVFGYYTSRVGRVEELGLPERVRVVRFQGCRHSEGEHGR